MSKVDRLERALSEERLRSALLRAQVAELQATEDARLDATPEPQRVQPSVELRRWRRSKQKRYGKRPTQSAPITHQAPVTTHPPSEHWRTVVARRIGSLFSGAGGLDLAVAEVLGAETAWVSDVPERDKKGSLIGNAPLILAHRFPHAPNLGDITRINWQAVESVDIITGGFPCPDVSTAGRRAGLIRGETRTGLWANMLTAIDVLRPSLVVAENVRGLLSARADSDVEPCPWCLGDGSRSSLRALGAVLGDLANIGYDAQWCGLRAADVGACHGRFRVFIVAHPRGEHGPQRRLAAPGQAPGGWALGELAGRSGAPVALLPTPTSRDTKGQNQRGDDSCLHGALLPTPRATDGTKGGPNQRGSSGDLMLPSAVLLPTPTKENDDAHPTSTPARQDLPRVRGGVQPKAVWPQTGRPDALPVQGDLLAGVREHQDEGGPRHAALAGAEAREGGVREVRHSRTPARSPRRPQPGEQRPSEPADSVRFLSLETALAGGSREASSGDHGCGCHAWGQFSEAVHRHEHLVGRSAPCPTEVGPKGQPRLSARAVEWMMCLPAGWVTDVPGLTRNQQLRALGNGVVPPQAAAALRHMLAPERAA